MAGWPLATITTPRLRFPRTADQSAPPASPTTPRRPPTRQPAATSGVAGLRRGTAPSKIYETRDNLRPHAEVVAFKGDSYRPKDRDLGRATPTKTED